MELNARKRISSKNWVADLISSLFAYVSKESLLVLLVG